MRPLTAVCPLLASDLDRFDNLVWSLDRYFDARSLHSLIVVVRDEDFEEVTPRVERAPFASVAIVMAERELDIGDEMPGWFRQQLIKLVIADHVETDFYLTLDADVLCCRPVSATDLVRNGRALMTIDDRQIHREWWQASAQILGVRPRISRTKLKRTWPFVEVISRPGMGVTPAILSASVVRDLRTFVEQKWGDDLSSVVRDRKFTEYTLYFLFLEMTGTLDEFHDTAEPVIRDGPNTHVWLGDQFEDWDVERAFRADEGAGFFTVCQSKSGISAQVVRERVERALGEAHS